MKRVLSLLCCVVLLASCATPAMISPSYSSGYSSHAEYMAANGIVPTGPLAPEPDPLTKALTKSPIPVTHTPPPQPMEWDGKAGSIPVSASPPSTGVSGWDVLGAIVAIPLLLPLAIITNSPGPGVHCRSYTYKDQYHTKCY